MIHFTSKQQNIFLNNPYKNKNTGDTISADTAGSSGEEQTELWLKLHAENNIVFAHLNVPRNKVKGYQENIDNYMPLKNNSARGATLSSKKNRKYLASIKKSGIDTIIDLRDKYKSSVYPSICEQYSFSYFNIPIDSSGVDDEVIIDNLPLLFELLNRGNYYISCAQGLHRTDIALSINYVFNPEENTPPVLKGHIRENKLITEDIIKRLNSIKKNITQEQLKNLGWDENFDDEFEKRKNNLKEFNQSLL